MESLLIQLGSLEHYQIAALASYLLFQGCYLGIIPEELIISTLGFLWAEGKIGFLESLVAVWLGLLAADTTTVFVGTHFGPKLLKMRPFCWIFNQEDLDENLREIKKYGSWIVFFTRFTPVIRGPIFLAAGLSQIGIFKFFRTDFLASCIYIPLLLWLGRYFGKNSVSMVDGYKHLGVVIGLFLLLGVLAKAILNRRKKHRIV